MAFTLNRYENMIREYLIEAQSDAYNSKNINYYKYNNLKVNMEPSKIKEPHFFVRIGISEACFEIVSGNLITGSVGSDTKYIPKWLNKPGVREELMLTWEMAKKVEFEELTKNE